MYYGKNESDYNAENTNWQGNDLKSIPIQVLTLITTPGPKPGISGYQ
jgi:hypothetical protein